MTPRLPILVAALLAGVALPAAAQVSTSAPPPAGKDGWSFTVTPYVWMPTIHSETNLTGPQGGTVTTNANIGVGDYFRDINFAFMGGAEARFQNFSVLTDIFYSSLKYTNDVAHISSFNPGSGPIDIPRSTQLGLGARLNATVWGLAAGWTVAQAEWGNVDVIGGLRMLGVGGNQSYTLTHDILLPNQTIGLSRTGSLGLGANYLDAVAGVRGRLNIPNSKFFLPYYLDVGTGAIPLTWQAYGGVGYQAGFADITLGYRWLAFQQNGSATVHNMDFGGVLLAAAFHF